MTNLSEHELTKLLDENPDLVLVTDASFTLIQSRTQRAPTPAAHLTESEMQKAVIAECNRRAEFDERWGWIFHPANGEYRTKATAGRLKKMGVRAGIPDLLLFLPMGKYHGMAMELKVGKNQPSPTQREWLARLERAGYYTTVIWDDPAAALQEFEWYLSGAA